MVVAALQMMCSTLSLEAQGALANVQRSLSVPSGTAVPHIAPTFAHLNVDAGFCSLPSQNCFGVSFSNPIPFVFHYRNVDPHTCKWKHRNVTKFTESELFDITN